MRVRAPFRKLALGPGAGALVLLALSGCASPASSGENARAKAGEPEPFRVSSNRKELAIGAFLADVDARIRAYTSLTLTANSQADLRKWHVLEEDLVYSVSERKDEILEQLETGPPNNRIVAAMALGFVRPPEEGEKLVPPLLNALHDPEDEVVNNALVALGMQASPQTPTAPLAQILGEHPDARMRVNAALALRKAVEAGASFDAEQLREVRHGLIDAEPGVIVQCCLLVGLLGDRESIGTLAALLPQKPALVCSAAAKGLALLGSTVAEEKGACARALALGFAKAGEELRPRIQRSLVELAGRNYGADQAAWQEWADRLP